MPALKQIHAIRIAATPAALDAIRWPADALVLRTAPDEVWTTAVLSHADVPDPHAILVPETGFAGVWLPAAKAYALLEQSCEWPLPDARPALAQGLVAELPLKLWLTEDAVFFLVPVPYAADFEERLQ